MSLYHPSAKCKAKINEELSLDEYKQMVAKLKAKLTAPKFQTSGYSALRSRSKIAIQGTEEISEFLFPCTGSIFVPSSPGIGDNACAIVFPWLQKGFNVSQ